MDLRLIGDKQIQGPIGQVNQSRFIMQSQKPVFILNFLDLNIVTSIPSAPVTLKSLNQAQGKLVDLFL